MPELPLPTTTTTTTAAVAPPDELAPEMRQFCQALAAGYAAHPPLASVSLAEARRIVEQVRAPLACGGPRMVRSRDIHIPVEGHGPLRLRLHEPAAPDAGPPRPALVYVHGGGWVFFSLDTHDRLMREYAARAGRVVIGVDYAQAPEARFPVALAQCVEAVRWLHREAERLGVAPGQISLGGDSVGANLSLATSLVLRDAGQHAMIDSLLLNYGPYSDDDASESFTRYDGPGYVLGKEEMRGFWRQYLRSEADRLDPLAQPLRAELEGLPACCLVVAECDVLRDSSLALAEKLAAARVPFTLRRYAGAPHSFLEAVSLSPLSQRALDETSAWLRARAAAAAPEKAEKAERPV